MSSVVRREMDGSTDDLLKVLADGWLYAGWVVGASRVRDVDASWPQKGARIHHSIGAWPVLIDDTTSVDAFDPQGLLQLHAKGWPVGTATVRITWQDLGADRLLVSIEEDAALGPARFIPPPVRRALLGPRNVESLRRLALLVDGRRQRGTGDLGD